MAVVWKICFEKRRKALLEFFVPTFIGEKRLGSVLGCGAEYLTHEKKSSLIKQRGKGHEGKK
jgi:hypothetical protein